MPNGSDPTPGPRLAASTADAKAARRERLAQAMRENLLKRKRRQRALDQAEEAGDGRSE